MKPRRTFPLLLGFFTLRAMILKAGGFGELFGGGGGLFFSVKNVTYNDVDSFIVNSFVRII